MTERVDQDRLADFVGGALDGTPDAAAVRVLIETDPGWAAAHADLLAATAAVSAELRSVGSRPHAVPEDVAARLDALFRPLESDRRAGSAPPTATDGRPGEPATAREVRSQGAAGGPVRSGPRTGARGAGGTAGAAPGGPGGSSRPGGTGPGRQTQSRRMRWAAGLSAAAAVIAVGVGFVSLLPGGRSDNATSAPDSAAGAAAPQLAASGPPAIASGRDYQPGSFGGLAGKRSQAQEVTPPPPADAGTPRQDQEAGGAPYGAGDDTALRATVPTELARLVSSAARQDCLDAIRQAHGGVPSLVEFARFTGRPALVVLLDDSRTGNGRQWVVVAGPDCGLVAGDVDELYNGPLT
jgi:hypothetical protein